MDNRRYAEERWTFIERLQGWFLHKNQFWLSISALAFCSILTLRIIMTFVSEENPVTKASPEFLLVPILSIFVLSIFWRSIITIFLSLAGSTMTYGGMVLFHSQAAATNLLVPYVANRLGYGIKHFTVISPDAVSDRYFIVGMFALAFCLAVAIKPNFFRPKNSEELPYRTWKEIRDHVASPRQSTIRLVPVSALLTYEERHLVARYKYIVLAIGGTKYLVTPYDWVPEDSVVPRDEETKSIIGIL